jgi:ubiquinone/menaquinone biosynthesis C-methylase UbiE
MNSAAERLRVRFYNSDPQWVNGTDKFARMVRQHLRPEMRILNLGAGPGRSSLHFDKQVRTVVGIDPDESIASHPRLSHKVRGVAEALPFCDRSFDLIYLDWVVEHLPSPDAMANEALRILKDGGRLLFRTGNLYHYSYGIASLTPHAFHEYLVGALVGEGEAHSYPTFYRMNTAAKVRQTMKRAGFVEEQLTMMEPDPAYVGMNRATFLTGVAYERMVNRFEVLQGLRANILGCFRKPS